MGDIPQDEISDSLIDDSKTNNSDPTLDQDKGQSTLVQATTALARPLKSSKAGLLLICFYTLFVLFAWIVTCILSRHPITKNHHKWATSYQAIYGDYGCETVNSHGSIALFCGAETSKLPLTLTDIKTNEHWRQGIQVIAAVMAVLAIPISSAICARAAVAYTQIRRNISLRQALALADRGWWDPFVMSRMMFPRGVGRYGTLFLFFAAIVCALGIVLPTDT